MKKSVMFILGLFLFASISLISAAIYNNVVSEEKIASLKDEGVSLVINPLWSAELQSSEGTSFVISFLDVEQIRKLDLATIWEGNWFYLQDSSDEYLADSSIVYVDYSISEDTCITYSSDESCGISKILLDFNSNPEFSSTTFAYNKFISDKYTRDLIANSNFTPQFELSFNPQTGLISEAKYNGENIEITDEAGFMSYGGFNQLNK